MKLPQKRAHSGTPAGIPFSNSSSVGHRQTSSQAARVRVFSLIGLVGGLFGGLLGIGGGSAIGPLLIVTRRLQPAQISGTTLAAVLLISIVGSSAYASQGNLNLELAWPIAIGSIAGSVLGALLAKRLSMRLLIVLFLAILPYFAAKEFWPSMAAPVISTSFVTLILLGVGTGFMSGLLGIGGASLIVPSLAGFFLIDHHAAQGIALSVALVDSMAGVATHARKGNINYRVLLYMAVPAIVAAVVGSLLSDHLSSFVLRNLFAAFMVVVWVTLLWRVVQDYLGAWTASPGQTGSGQKQYGNSGLRFGNIRDRTMDLHRRVGGIYSGRVKIISRGNVMNAMLVFIPLAVVGHWYWHSPVLVFTCSAISCVALSYRLGQATESLGSRLGPVAGGLLNATFGNAAELVISIAALNHGLFLVVRMGLIGSILGQLLLVLGTSLLAAGILHKKLSFSRSLVQINFTLMALAMVAIGLPSMLLIVEMEELSTSAHLLAPILSGLLLIVYGFAVVFSLRSQPEEQHDGGDNQWSATKALLILAVSTGGIVLVSELLVGNILPFVESTGISEAFVGLILIPIFGNVVDHIVAISVAMKNRMDLSLTISVGSAAQVACLVLPIIVLIGFVTGQSQGLVFTPLELFSLGAGLLLMVPVLLDGESNWLEGTQLLTCYLILAVVLWTI